MLGSAGENVHTDAVEELERNAGFGVLRKNWIGDYVGLGKPSLSLMPQKGDTT